MPTFAGGGSHPSEDIMRKRLIYEDNTGVHCDWPENLPDEGDMLQAEYMILGTACEREKFQDRCSTDCLHYRRGTCTCGIIRDSEGQLWHIEGRDLYGMAEEEWKTRTRS